MRDRVKIKEYELGLQLEQAWRAAEDARDALGTEEGPAFDKATALTRATWDALQAHGQGMCRKYPAAPTLRKRAGSRF